MRRAVALCLGDRDRVGGGEPLDTRRGACRDVVAVHHQLQAPSCRRAVAGTVEVEHRHAVQAGVRDQPLVTGDVPVVEDHHQLLAAPGSAGRCG